MSGVSGNNSALEGYTGQETTGVNMMNFGLKHAPAAASIDSSLDLLTCSPVHYNYAMASPSKFVSGGLS